MASSPAPPRSAPALPRSAPALFSHVVADNAPLYRAILDVFAASKRQFRLHLRPDEVLAEAVWTALGPGPAPPPSLEAVQQALGQLVDWGNLQSQPIRRASRPSKTFTANACSTA